MNLGRLNHVGVATPSIERSVALYRDLLGATKIHEPFDLPPQGVRVCFVDTPNSQIELIEPLGENSPLHGFLARNPAGGQHHVCFEVPDIIAARDRLKEAGARSVRIVCLLATPQGVDKVQAHHPDVHIWTAAIDEELDASGYIVPGVGDVGDRMYGTK